MKSILIILVIGVLGFVGYTLLQGTAAPETAMPDTGTTTPDTTPTETTTTDDDTTVTTETGDMENTNDTAATDEEDTLMVDTDVAAEADADVAAEAEPATVREFTLDSFNYGYSETELRVNEGDTVTINLTNSDGFHDWVLDEFDAATEQIQAGDTTSVTFVADEAGTYEYYCSVGSHRAQGMVGTLIVE